MRSSLGHAVRVDSPSARRGVRVAAARRSIVTAKPRSKTRPGLTIDQAIRERMLDEGVEWSSYWRTNVNRYARRCASVLGPVPLDSLSIEHVEKLKRSWPAGSLEWNRARSVLLSTWRRAQRRGLISIDRVCPAAAVLAHREPKITWQAPEGHHLELDRAVVEAVARGKLSADVGCALRLLAFTARRPSEILHAEAANVRPELGLLYLATTKIGEPQTVPLQGLALELAIEAKARALASGSRWLFPRRRDASKPIGLSTLTRSWHGVLEVAATMGIATTRSDGRRYLARDFRPLGITAMARAGCQPNVIAKVVGHKSTTTTERYLRLSDDDSRRAQGAITKGNMSRDRDALLTTIAANVKRLREAKGLTQTACAARFGCSRQYWSQLELSGKVDVLALLKAADVLGTTLEGLGVR